MTPGQGILAIIGVFIVCGFIAFLIEFDWKAFKEKRKIKTYEKNGKLFIKKIKRKEKS